MWIDWTELNWYIYPLPLSLHPTPLGHHRAQSWAPCTIQQLPSSCLFTTLCCCSLAQSCPALYNPMDCSMPGFLDLQYLSEFAQTHVHWVSDTSQPFHPLSPLLLLPSIFTASEACPMSQLFTSGGQSSGASASASVLPMNIQGWFPLGLTGLISLMSKGLSRVFSNTTVQKHQFFGTWLSFWTNSYTRTWVLEKIISLTVQIFVSKMMSQLFNMLSRFIMAFLPKSKHLLISWLQSPSTVILEPKKIICHCFHFFPIYLPWSDETGYHDLRFWGVFLLMSFSFFFNFITIIILLYNIVWVLSYITGMTQRDGMDREVGGGFRIGNTCTPWQIHVDVWQNVEF